MRFLLVSDPAFPTFKPWWVVHIKRGDFATVMHASEWHSKALLIRDGKDPHIQADRDNPESNGHLLACLKHPVMLGAAFLQTALKMVERGDFYVNHNGGMRPTDRLTVLDTVEGNQWPGVIDPFRKVIVSTWGNHFYLTTGHTSPMTFLTKYDTEQAAMDVAKLFASPDNITVKREPVSYRSGD